MAQAPVKIRRVDLYPDDFLGGTAMLDDVEMGIYCRACFLIYSTGGPIKLEHLRAVAKSHGNAFNRALRNLFKLRKLIENDSEIDQKRCGNELEKARKRVANITNSTGCEPRPSAARETPPTPPPSLDSLNPTENGGTFDQIDKPKRKANPRALGTNPRTRGTNPRAQREFNQLGVTEHRAAFAPLRDPVEIAISLGLRDASGKLR